MYLTLIKQYAFGAVVAFRYIVPPGATGWRESSVSGVP